MRWYVSQDGKTSGPFTEQRIAMLVNWGKINSEAYLCDEKWACWVSLKRSQFAPLLGELPPDPPPPALSEPPGAHGWWGQRMALAVLLMLTAAAFLLSVWLSPHVPPGPLGELGGGAAPAAHIEGGDSPV